MRRSWYLEELLDSSGHLHFHTEFFCLDFHDLSDTSFEVEISDATDGFWAISEVGIVAARKSPKWCLRSGLA